MPHSENSPTAAINNPLREAAERVWQDNTCQEGLLRWQDDHHVDINLCLCLAWIEAQQQPLSTAQYAGLIEISEQYQSILQPLRAARRGVKTLANDLYPLYLDMELKTEYKELAQLYKFSQNLVSDRQLQRVGASTDAIHTVLSAPVMHYLQSNGNAKGRQDLSLAAKLVDVIQR